MSLTRPVIDPARFPYAAAAQFLPEPSRDAFARYVHSQWRDPWRAPEIAQQAKRGALRDYRARVATLSGQFIAGR